MAVSNINDPTERYVTGLEAVPLSTDGDCCFHCPTKYAEEIKTALANPLETTILHITQDGRCDFPEGPRIGEMSSLLASPEMHKLSPRHSLVYDEKAVNLIVSLLAAFCKQIHTLIPNNEQ